MYWVAHELQMPVEDVAKWTVTKFSGWVAFFLQKQDFEAKANENARRRARSKTRRKSKFDNVAEE